MAILHTTSIDLLTGDQPAEKSAGVTVDTTGQKVDVSERQQITIQFRGASITTGNGVFSIDGSNDGTNWTTGLAMHDMTQTAGQTNVASVTISANGSKMVSVQPGFRYIRAVLDLTTNGTYFAALEAGG